MMWKIGFELIGVANLLFVCGWWTTPHTTAILNILGIIVFAIGIIFFVLAFVRYVWMKGREKVAGRP